MYEVRPRMLEAGFEVEQEDKEKITGEYMRDICEQHGFYRDELGIIAAAKAQIYYRSKTYAVGLDQINLLSMMGTDLIIIKKESVVEALGPFADKYRIALMYTRGFAVEYIQRLADVANLKDAMLYSYLTLTQQASR